MPRIVQAVILAGGLGTRLWPLTIATPKPLLPVMGRPLLAHLLERLPARVEEVFLAVSFKAQEVQDWVDRGEDPALAGRRVHVVAEDPPLGTGGALANLVDTAGFGSDGDPVLVLNGDLMADLDLEALVGEHETRGPAGTLALVAVQDPSRFGIMELGEDWRIRAFIEKPPREKAPSKWANAGAYVLASSVLTRIPRGRRVSLEREVFPGLATEEPGLYGTPHRGLWVDCGTRESYLEAHRALMEKEGGTGTSWSAPDVRVAEDARVERSVVLAGAVVGAGARVTDSIIGLGAVVGDKAAVESSVIADGAHVAPGARIRGGRIVAVKE